MPALWTSITVPETPPTVEEARPYLIGFVDWVLEFFELIDGEYGNGFTSPPSFVPELIQYLSPSLNEARESGMFDQAREALQTLSADHIRLHGLFGSQLQWKLSTASHWFERFIAVPGRHLFERLLDAIDAILESILESIPGGKGIVEIKEAIRNAADIADGEYD